MSALVPPDFRLGHQPALDGLRGLAIALVIASNWELPWATGAYIGVDLFFVLSGFLITGLLLQERAEKSRIRLAYFYARRALRLLPALLLLLGVYAVYLLALSTRQWSAIAWPGILSVLFYVANWFMVLVPDGQEKLGPLAHTWSLAVEEQFYLSWPLLLAAWLVRRPSTRSVLLMLGAAILACGLWRAHLQLAGRPPLRLYAGTDTRCDALLLGCLLAVALSARGGVVRPDERYPRWLGWAALVPFMGIAMTVPWRSPGLYLGGATVVGLLALLLVLSAVKDDGAFGAMFRWPPLRWLGRVSYGVYLWHVPVAVAFAMKAGVKHPGQSPYWFFLTLAVTFAIAVPSYYLLELPIMRRGRRFKSRMRRGPVARRIAAPSLHLVAAVQRTTSRHR